MPRAPSASRWRHRKGLRKAKFRSLRLASKNESWEGRVGKIRSDRKPNNTIIRTSVQTSEICNGKLRRGMLAARHSGMLHKRHKSRGGGGHQKLDWEMSLYTRIPRTEMSNADCRRKPGRSRRRWSCPERWMLIS